jgi:hypothetical protein
MGLAGVSGPFRGAYNILQASTASVGAGSASGVQYNMFNWTVPAGMDIEIVDAQVYCATAGTATRVNILAGGASILNGAPGTISNLGDVLGGVVVLSGGTIGVGQSTQATLSKNVFGTTATSISNSVTPSSPGNVVNRGYAYGAYVVGGATLSVTVSGTGASTPLTVTMLWFPRSHPSALRSNFE